MKSQPEYPIRRLAVFGGYGHSGPEPTYARVTPREQREAEVEDTSVVIHLDALARPAQLWRAA